MPICPRCRCPLTAMPAPPASTIYICDDSACSMNDVITYDETFDR